MSFTCAGISSWAVCVALSEAPLCNTTMTDCSWSDSSFKVLWRAFKLRCEQVTDPGWNNISSGNAASTETGLPAANMSEVGLHVLGVCTCSLL